MELEVINFGEQKRCGYVAIIGSPNVGKSTLLNKILGKNYAVVSHKAHTTRTRLRGIFTDGASQVVFVDTPGIFISPKSSIKSLVSEAWKGASEADVVILLTDVRNPSGVDHDKEMLQQLLNNAKGQKIAVVINKIDLKKREELLVFIKMWSEYKGVERVFLISALKNDGVFDICSWLASVIPQREWLYPKDQAVDRSPRSLAEEITRGKILVYVHDEIPHSVFVKTKKWKQEEDGSLNVHQDICVIKKSHKGILIGENARTVKAIGQDAREEITSLLGIKTHLFLKVRVVGENEKRRQAEGFVSID
jgi:GTP-binding protein Era